MKAIATCIEGLEKVTIKEIKTKLKTKAQTLIPTKVIFETTKEQLAYFSTVSRSTLNLYHLIKKSNKLPQEVKIPYKFKTFAVRCKRIGNHNFSSKDIEHEIGKNINAKADLKNPQLTIKVDIIKDLYLMGVLYADKLEKRHYRIKTNPLTINATLAYALIQTSNYKKKDSLLDPLCKEGTIPIEAYLETNKIPHQKELEFTKLLKIKTKQNKPKQLKIFASDSMFNNIKSTRTNAKLAKAKIETTKADLDWLETKYNQIDKIITSITKTTNINELLNQNICKDITILTQKELPSLKTKLKIKHGNNILYIQKLIKK